MLSVPFFVALPKQIRAAGSEIKARPTRNWNVSGGRINSNNFLAPQSCYWSPLSPPRQIPNYSNLSSGLRELLTVKSFETVQQWVVSLMHVSLMLLFEEQETDERMKKPCWIWLSSLKLSNFSLGLNNFLRLGKNNRIFLSLTDTFNATGSFK